MGREAPRNLDKIVTTAHGYAPTRVPEGLRRLLFCGLHRMLAVGVCINFGLPLLSLDSEFRYALRTWCGCRLRWRQRCQ